MSSDRWAGGGGDEVVCLPLPDTDPDIHLLSEPGEPITSQPDHNKWPL